MKNSVPQSAIVRQNLATQILISLVIGVGCGLFFGELCAPLRWIGDGYVGLLQMAVLPYVTLSLIANIGRLSVGEGSRLAWISFIVLALLWSLGFLMMLLMSLSFPDWANGSFFSTGFIEEPPTPNWLDLFIPSNPFRSLANDSIPAVVIFSIGLGIALIGMRNKTLLLDQLDVLVAALARLNKLVVSLSPIGIFAIAAYASGTLDIAQFGLLQGYLLAYGAAAVLATLVILPALIACCTPFSYREVLSESRDALVAAFVIGNTFVVLPMIVEGTRRLFERHADISSDLRDLPEYVIPMAYPFPDIGRIIALLFLPFAAWFYGTSIDSSSYPALIGVGLLSSFGKLVVTMPLLLSIAELPSDIFNLFLSLGVITSRFGDAMKAMHLITFATIVSAAVAGALRIRWYALLVNVALSSLVLGLSVVGIRTYLHTSFKDVYAKEKLLTDRQLLTTPVPSTLLTAASPNPDPLLEGENHVERIRRRGIIRIGFDGDELPFAYFGADGTLVGFDIDMAHRLARDLDVEIEFVPFTSPSLFDQLQNDHFDVAMSGIEGTLKRAATLPLGDSYMDVTLGLVVLDHDKGEFRSIEALRAKEHLQLAVLAESFFAERLAAVLPNVEVVVLNSEASFFEDESLDVDALVTSAETGAAWTLLKPRYSVVNPLERSVRVPLYYLTPAEEEFREFLKRWLELKRKEGLLDRFYDHWILGKSAEATTPRWSILRNVLGWME